MYAFHVFLSVMDSFFFPFLCNQKKSNVPQTEHGRPSHTHTDSDVAWLWAAALTRCLSLTVSLSQEGGSLMDSSGALRLPLYTAWLELNQKEVTSDL